jgi:CRP/FNR family transcriptional regulator
METNNEIIEILNKRFPDLYEQELKQEIASFGTIKVISAGESLIDIGQYVKTIPLVIDGKIKIFREDEEANELFLYYLYPGDACAISLVCTINNKISLIKAISVDDTTVIAIPIEKMDYLMMKYRSWYQFVVRTYGNRLEEMLNTIDDIAFNKMDERIVNYLYKAVEANGSRFINSTHQEIAQELNTSREVVSRLLKQLEKRGLLKLSRNQIEVIFQNTL